MPDTVELEISITGMEKAIAEVMRLGGVAQRQIDELTVKAAQLGLGPGAGPNVPGAGGGTGGKRTRKPVTEDEAMKSAWGRVNPDKTETRYWLNKWRKDDAIFQKQDRILQRQEEQQRQTRNKILSGMATGAAAAVTASTVYGFHGTAEGAKFSNELSMISRELAGIFKPVMDLATNALAGVRGFLQSRSVGEQNALLGVGAAAAGAYGLNKVGLLAPMAKDAAMLGARGIGSKLPYVGAAIGMAQAAYTFTRPLSPEQEEARRTGTPRQNMVDRFQRNIERILDITQPLAGISVLNEFVRGNKKVPNNDRRRVMDVSTVGYGSVGSTADMIQEEFLKTGGDSTNSTVEDIREVLKKILDYAELFARNSPAGIAARAAGFF